MEMESHQELLGVLGVLGDYVYYTYQHEDLAETAEEVIEILSSEGEEELEQSNFSEEFEPPQESLIPHKTKINTLECYICQKTFRSNSRLKIHLKNHTETEKIYSENHFPTSSLLQTHLNRNLTINPHKCFDCEESFVTRLELVRHIKSHRRDYNKDCGPTVKMIPAHQSEAVEVEAQVGISEDALRSHEYSEQVFGGSKKVLTSDVCRKSQKRDHYHQENLHLPHLCDVCGELFVNEAYLSAHLQQHLGMSEYSCAICESSFISPFELEVHHYQHLDTKSYKCGKCKLSFAARSELKTHLKIYHNNNNAGGNQCVIIEHHREREHDSCQAPETEVLNQALGYSDNSTCAGVLVKDEIMIAEAFSDAANLEPNLCFNEVVEPNIVLEQISGLEESIINLPVVTDVSNKANSQPLPTYSVDRIQKLRSCELWSKNETYSIQMENQRQLLGDNMEDCEEALATHEVYLIQSDSDLEILSGRESEGPDKTSFSGEFQCSNESFARELKYKNSSRCEYGQHESSDLLKEQRIQALDCHICQKTLPNSSHLKAHLKEHQFYKCALCELCFTRPCDLQDHQDLHKGSKQHRCYSCKRAFVHRFELEQHMLAHRDEGSSSVTVATEDQEEILTNTVHCNENVLEESGLHVVLIKQESGDAEGEFPILQSQRSVFNAVELANEAISSNQGRMAVMPHLKKVQVNPGMTGQAKALENSQIETASRDSYNDDSSSYTNHTGFTESPSSPSAPSTSRKRSTSYRGRGRPSKLHSYCPSREELQKLSPSERRKVEYRAKNNEASRLSRLRRKQREAEESHRAELVQRKNNLLKQKLEQLTRIEQKLHRELSITHFPPQ